MEGMIFHYTIAENKSNAKRRKANYLSDKQGQKQEKARQLCEKWKKHKDEEREKKGFFSLLRSACAVLGNGWVGWGFSAVSGCPPPLLTVSGGVSYGNRGEEEEEEAQPAKLRVRERQPFPPLLTAVPVVVVAASFFFKGVFSSLG